MPRNGPAEQPNAEIGYSRVDVQPDTALLIKGMEATAEWPAVRQLRAWERTRLALQAGERLLDVGCGFGDVAIALAAEVTPTGSVIAIDASEAMLSVGRQRAAEAAASVDFRIGDAEALPYRTDRLTRVGASGRCSGFRTPIRLWRRCSACFDLEGVSRSSRPTGGVCCSTCRIELLRTRVGGAIWALRGPAFDLGGRILNLARELGLEAIDVTGAAHVWTRWNPDTEVAPSGLFPIRTIVDQLVELDYLAADMAERFVVSVEDAARRDRLCISLCMLAVSGHRPS